MADIVAVIIGFVAVPVLIGDFVVTFGFVTDDVKTVEDAGGVLLFGALDAVVRWLVTIVGVVAVLGVNVTVDGIEVVVVDLTVVVGKVVVVWEVVTLLVNSVEAVAFADIVLAGVKVLTVGPVEDFAEVSGNDLRDVVEGCVVVEPAEVVSLSASIINVIDCVASAR